MVFREVSVIEIREVLRSWLAGAGLRTVAAQAGVDRKTARRYVEAAVAAGLARDGGPGQLSDELVGQVAEAVRPVRPGGHGQGWDRLESCREEIQAWVKQGLTVVKIGVLLERQGVAVPYRDAAPVLRGALRVRPFRGDDGAGGGRRAGDGVPAGLRLPGLAGRSGVRAAAQGARADLHRVLFAAHVRVAELHPDPGRVPRRVRGRLGVLRRRVPGPGSRQRPGDRRGRRRGQSPVHRRLAGLYAGQGVRH